METRVFFKNGDSRTFKNVMRTRIYYDYDNPKNPYSLSIEDLDGNEFGYNLKEIDLFFDWRH